MKAAAQNLPDAKASIGIRAQSLRIGPTDDPRDLVLALRVNVCEYLGTESVLSCTLGDEPGTEVSLTAAGNHTRLAGSEITAHAALDSLYAFEAGTHGLSLSH